MYGQLATRPRVVVTGIGLITCLGVGTSQVWKKIIEGECGITNLDGQEYAKIPSKLVGRVKDGDGPGEFNLTSFKLKMDLKTCSRGSLFALVAANEAITQAKLDLNDVNNQMRTGAVIGMSMISTDEISEVNKKFEVGYNKVSPHFIPKILPNMAAGLVSMQFGIKGLNHAVATACTSGLHSIGDASRFIQHGDIDIAVCGSAEACLGPLTMAGFGRLRALSTNFNDRPQESSRPFDGLRDGFVMAEGSCMMVLESLESAIKRGVEPIAEILGYGLSSDACFVTAPSPNGEGAQRCMEAALRDAGVEPSRVGYVNAHATSTPLGDKAEAEAIHRTFIGDVSKDPSARGSMGPAVSSTKGALGHMLGGAGSVEAAFVALACRDGVLPPSLNLNDVSSLGVDLDFVRNSARGWEDAGRGRRIGVTNSFGFGGTNASICIGQFVS